MGETDRTTKGLMIAAALLGACAAVVFVVVAASRVAYPYEIEFQEGDVFLASLRVLDGRPIYPDPDTDATHVPVLYTPFFYIAGAGAIALLDNLLGKSLAACRAVSILSTLVLIAMIAHLGRRRAGWWWGIACTGAFCAFYAASGWWFDLARVDMLFLAFVAGAFVLIDRDVTTRRLVLAAALLVAAIFTKQVAVFFAATACLAVFLRAPRRGVALGAGIGAATLVIGAWLNAASDGQFVFFTLVAPRSHPVHLERLLEPWGLARAVGCLALACVAATVANRGRGDSADAPCGARFTWALFLLAALPASLLPWIKQGHYLNNFIPIALALVLTAASMRPTMLAAALLAAQMVVTWQSPTGQIPSAERRARGDAFIERLRAEPGDLYVMDHPYYAWLAGREVLAKGMFIAEAEKAGRMPPRALARRIDANAFAKILVDVEPPFDPFSSRILRRYRVAGPIDAPEPLTGTLVMRPRLALVPVEVIASVEFGDTPPPGWAAQGDAWISPPLPAASSVSFDIDAASGTVARLIGGDGKAIFATRGVPDSPPMRARWPLDRCAAAPCVLHFSNPMTSRPNGVTGLQIER
ncbi:MAG: DUF2029 domain-containing protein [Deltaproteobacteria bacterium]|nr:DUF2029 domain-containing protein [Deltaproteobacteria bacterium]